MDHHSETDLEIVAVRLRAERPGMEPTELDALKRRIHSRRTTPRRTPLMKSRLAITMLLVLGMVFSTAGAGLAVSGGSDSGNAADRQYPKQATDVLGEIGEVEEDAPAPQAQSAPETTQAAPAQPAQQLQATNQGGELPFTGFAAGTVLLMGIAMLIAGFTLRRRLASDES